jgi:tRNA splicing ligase
MGFRSVDMMGDVFNTLFSVIRQYLNDNVKDGEECGVKLDGVIEFRAAVEDGVIVMSAEPDGEIKKIIKDDAKIEK